MSLETLNSLLVVPVLLVVDLVLLKLILLLSVNITTVPTIIEFETGWVPFHSLIFILILLRLDWISSEKLFNIKDDPGERIDLSGQYPDKVKALELAYQDWCPSNIGKYWKN